MFAHQVHTVCVYNDIFAIRFVEGCRLGRYLVCRTIFTAGKKYYFFGQIDIYFMNHYSQTSCITTESRGPKWRCYISLPI